ncbi:putative inner membrane protein [Falsiruegeria litorea R37]|uniref:Putative inner membrane protein n=1 Tax=Falsiruegeria litorea R37 TaxID=1200284 RepID=A0A1Y5SAF6_9RHOB|nr:YeeE/YedE family protein [Falsiruegeria litorea]SLN33631.1 putative inner membrane protein [Falsiruegeria litorea R37]
MFETFGFEETTAKQASVALALILGAIFGFLAERTGFCFRRAVVGEDRRSAAGVWMMALAVAVIGTQWLVSAELITFDEHRFMASEFPILAIVLGGVMFGIGMVLTRGCVSRLTVLGGTGNLRALLVLLVFAVVAHAMLKGVLAPLRVAVGSVTFDLGSNVSLATLPGGAWLYAGALGGAALITALRSGNGPLVLLGAALIGALAPLGWVGTGYILLDEFDPIALESLSFTSPAADSLFYTVASTSILPGFGVGLMGGVLTGALVAALLFGSFRWQSFESPRQTGRYLAGAALMGMGGVLAGGCTVGAGLSGVPTLSVAAITALLSIAFGGKLADQAIRSASGSGAPSATPTQQPAE